jgi:hypothetical protein
MTNPLRRLLDLLDAAITRRADARARAMGLTIERIPGTRIHLYSRGGRGYAYRPQSVSAAERPAEGGER